ncbi:P13 [Epinotia aporema granulovirus]|uniref:p13 n=1 Tax=Epinotia aporema granulovirus TaxID=166056 RepID=K4EQT0_9BBAC|nr:P13 [Epinotia aporema granulovirus]AER41471.1 P13 [Epinotia aporema granulovirus]
MKCAYVTLVMLGDTYVPGATALAKSLILSGTCHDLVCMVTDDVTVTELLRSVFNKIISVPYVSFKCGEMMTERQRQLYGDWIDKSFTKWRCFDILNYDKCIYLDADQIVTQNIDHVFNLAPPAMCFNFVYNKMFKNFSYGSVITPKQLALIFNNCKILGFTGTLLYQPNKIILQEIIRLLSPSNAFMREKHFHNGYDEIVLMQALIKLNYSVTQLSPMYVWNAGEYTTLKNSQPYIINYYGDDKPWVKNKTIRYIDEYIWKYFYEKQVSLADKNTT